MLDICKAIFLDKSIKMSDNEGGGGEAQLQETPDPTPTIASVKPVAGCIRKLQSKTQVYLSGKLGFVQVCNYVFEIIGRSGIF